MPATKEAPASKKILIVDDTVSLSAFFREAFGGAKFEPNDATREIPVIIIEEGMGNAADRHIYSADLLGRNAARFTGVQAYADHPTKTEEVDQPERSVRTLVGYYKEAHAETIGGKIKVAAVLKILDGPSYDWAWSLVKEAWNYAKQFPGKNLVGISINAFGTSHVVDAADGKPGNLVDEFTEIQSADIVTRAGAGGGIRVREGAKLLEAVTKALDGVQTNGGTAMSKSNDAKKTAAQILKEAEAEAGSLGALMKAHHEALKSFHASIQKDPAYSKEYGPAMEKIMKAHEEALKHAEGIHVNLGQQPAPEEQPDKKEGQLIHLPDPGTGAQGEAYAELSKMEAAYKAGKLSANEAKLYEILKKDREERAIRENVAMVAAKIKESGIPEAYQGDLPILCAGKSEAEVSKIVEARKALVAPLIGNRGQGAGAEQQSGGSAHKGKLAEKLAATGMKMKEAAKA